MKMGIKRRAFVCFSLLVGTCVGIETSIPDSTDGLYSQFVESIQAMAGELPREGLGNFRSGQGVDPRNLLFGPMAEMLCANGDKYHRTNLRENLEKGNPEGVRSVLEGPCQVKLTKVEEKSSVPREVDIRYSTQWSKSHYVNVFFQLTTREENLPWHVPSRFRLEVSLQQDVWNRGSFKTFLTRHVGTLMCKDYKGLGKGYHGDKVAALECNKFLGMKPFEDQGENMIIVQSIFRQV